MYLFNPVNNNSTTTTLISRMVLNFLPNLRLAVLIRGRPFKTVYSVWVGLSPILKH